LNVVRSVVPSPASNKQITLPGFKSIRRSRLRNFTQAASDSDTKRRYFSDTSTLEINPA
jgi:hypothetical protein